MYGLLTDDKETWRLLGVILITVIGSSVVINASLVCLFCYKGRYNKSYHQAYINLAVSDFFFSVWGVAFTAPNYLYGREEADLLCSLTPILGSYLLTTNLMAVPPIAIDRLVAVYLPMRYKAGLIHRRVLRASMGLCWIIPAVYMAVVVSIYKFQNTAIVSQQPHPQFKHPICDFNAASHLYSGLQISRFLLFYCSAITIVVFLYILIIKKVRAGSGGRPAGCRGGNRGSARSTSNLVVIIRAALVCLVIIVSWTPYSIIHVMPRDNVTRDVAGATRDVDLRIFAYAVYYIGCLANPFLYVISSKAIRASLRRLTRKTRQSVRRISRVGRATEYTEPRTSTS